MLKCDRLNVLKIRHALLKLRAATVKNDKKSLRRRLRRLGHNGGLTTA